VRRYEWGELIEKYLDTRTVLRGVIQLIDLRHPPQSLDHSMAEWLHHRGHPYLVVGAKADKVAKTKVSELLLKVAESLNIDSRDTIAFSAQTGFNRDRLWRWVIETVNAGT